jgi:hypothetical protein
MLSCFCYISPASTDHGPLRSVPRCRSIDESIIFFAASSKPFKILRWNPSLRVFSSLAIVLICLRCAILRRPRSGWDYGPFRTTIAAEICPEFHAEHKKECDGVQTDFPENLIARLDAADATGRSINEAKGGIGNSLKLTFRAGWKALGGSQEQGDAKIR